VGRIADETLTDKQSAFVAEYLHNGFNATRAAIAAGYAKETAYSEGGRQLRNVDVVAAIKVGLDKNGITPDRIDCEFAQMAMGTDPAELNKLLEGGATLADLREMGFDTRQIKKIKSRREVKGQGANATAYDVTEVEMYDRLAALEKMGKVRAMFTERRETIGDSPAAVVHVNVGDIGDVNRPPATESEREAWRRTLESEFPSSDGPTACEDAPGSQSGA